MYNHLLTLQDLSKDDILDTLDLAVKLKHDNKNGIKHNELSGKSLAMIFSKSSTRTRVSFEVGMYQLGGQALFLSGNDLQLNRGESVEDTARVLSRYVHGIMIRTFEQQDVEDLAKYGNVPVINGLTDYCHPCQILADLMTIQEYKGSLDNLKLCFIGDGNNVANSLIVGGLKVGMTVVCASPQNHKPAEKVLKFAEEFGNKFVLTDNVMTAAEDADILITDVWSSMGQEKDAETRKKEFIDYKINKEVLKIAKKDVIIQHCLPAHKGEEITYEIFEEHSKEIFDEAENRLHAQKAVMLKLMA